MALGGLAMALETIHDPSQQKQRRRCVADERKLLLEKGGAYVSLENCMPVP